MWLWAFVPRASSHATRASLTCLTNAYSCSVNIPSSTSNTSTCKRLTHTLCPLARVRCETLRGESSVCRPICSAKCPGPVTSPRVQPKRPVIFW